MIDHYSSNVLHEARQRDLMNEAKGGWLLRQARDTESTPRKSNVARRILPIVLIGVALLIAVLLLTFATTHSAAADASNTSTIAGNWYGNTNFSDVNPQFTAEGISRSVAPPAIVCTDRRRSRMGATTARLFCHVQFERQAAN